MLFKYWAAFLIFTAAVAFADTPAASRIEGGIVHYYAALHEAFEASAGISQDQPDEITLLLDVILDEPIILDTAKHIRLVADGSRTIQRGSDNPLFWLTGESATLTLGKPKMENQLTIDGAYLNEPSLEALAPLIAINGPDSKLIMYDNVIIQNNYNYFDGAGTTLHQSGAGVYIRTSGENFGRQAEFLMKGGIIRGNINNLQNPIPCGGGVFIAGAGIFTMEGGTIMNRPPLRRRLPYRQQGHIQKNRRYYLWL
jgi:hypothetical protein